MMCPECVAEGERSRVYDGPQTWTSMYVETFWDEDGVRHIHDQNWHGQSFSCSNGHRWSEAKQKPCPAGDWPTQETLTDHDA